MIPALTIPAISGDSAAVADSLDLASDRVGQPLDPDQSRSWLESRDSVARLRWGWDTFAEHFALTTSFGIQSAVLLHQLSQLTQSLGGVKIPVIWVDTGYLPPETYRYAEQLLQRLPLDLRVVQSDLSPARMEAIHGRLWESSEAEDRQLYNQIRKARLKIGSSTTRSARSIPSIAPSTISMCTVGPVVYAVVKPITVAACHPWIRSGGFGL